MNVVGETLFPEYTYNAYLLFVRKDGLYVSATHFKRPDFDENRLRFQKIALVKCIAYMKNRHASLLILCCLLLFASCHSHQGDDNRGVTYPQYVAILNINQSLQKKEAVFEREISFYGRCQ